MSVKIVAFIFLIFLLESTAAQKGEKSISAGLFFSSPALHPVNGNGYLNTSFGLEVTGQFNISQNSALLLQTGLVSHRYDPIRTSDDRLTLFSLRGGYRYQFGATGIFLNALPGIDVDLSDFYAPPSFSIGAGKRFRVKDVYFIDVGIDYIQSQVMNRANIKAAFSILRRPKPENNRLL